MGVVVMHKITLFWRRFADIITAAWVTAYLTDAFGRHQVINAVLIIALLGIFALLIVYIVHFLEQ